MRDYRLNLGRVGFVWIGVLFVMMGCTAITAVSPTNPTPISQADPADTPSIPMPTVTTEPSIIPTLPPTETPLPDPTETPVIAVVETAVLVPTPTTLPPVASPTSAVSAVGITQTIGFSVQGRPIVNYRFGIGTQQLVLVGGIHGGYEWNSILMAYEAINYFSEFPDMIPSNVTLHIIPAANPDGLFLVTSEEGRFTSDDVSGSIENGRFNANQVDLNRNWDCNWQPEGNWGERIVNAGEAPFSEPETQAMRRFFLGQQVDAVIFYHSKADGVYAGGCGDVYPPSLELTTIYGEASGYPIYQQFTHYQVTGDASDWLAIQNIPSFTVELKTRNGLDWPENLAGIMAILAYYGER